jgi:hypothetical protein
MSRPPVLQRDARRRRPRRLVHAAASHSRTAIGRPVTPAEQSSRPREASRQDGALLAVRASTVSDALSLADSGRSNGRLRGDFHDRRRTARTTIKKTATTAAGDKLVSRRAADELRMEASSSGCRTPWRTPAGYCGGRRPRRLVPSGLREWTRLPGASTRASECARSSALPSEQAVRGACPYGRSAGKGPRSTRTMSGTWFSV